jgi:uncharacterized membrane protein
MRISTSERVWGVFGYLAFLFIIPVKVRKDSIFVQFHARQGGVLFGLWALLVLILVIVLFFVDGIDLAATILLTTLFVVTVLYVLMMLVGIFKVLLGERYRMPVVADVALLLRL